MMEILDWDRFEEVLIENNFLLHETEIEWWFHNPNMESLIVSNKVSELRLSKAYGTLFVENLTSTSVVTKNVMGTLTQAA